MKVKMILPALTEARSPLFRPIKYSLFPPLGLATLAAYLPADAEITLQDEHVEHLDLSDEPDLVIIQVYITSASRAYRYADLYRKKGAHVCLGGLHVTSLPDEAAAHADTIFLGPGEDTFPEFLRDFKVGRPKPRYSAPLGRTLDHLPPMRRDLIKRDLYLVPNSIIVSRGCPHHCDFCYKDAFFGKGTGFHVMTPYPGTALFQRMEAEGRVLHRDWDLYDTRHTVFRPARMTPEQLENGYWHAYGRFYEWGNILKGAMTKESAGALRHIAYAGGWKKFEWVWHALIRMKQVALGLPLLERALDLTRPPRSAVRERGGQHAPAPVPALPRS